MCIDAVKHTIDSIPQCLQLEMAFQTESMLSLKFLSHLCAHSGPEGLYRSCLLRWYVSDLAQY